MKNVPNFENLKHYLPAVALDIAQVVGFDNLEKIIKAYGGSVRMLSEKGKDFNSTVELIGYESAVKLARYFGCEDIYLPRCNNVLNIQRRISFVGEVEKLEAQGFSRRGALRKLCPIWGVSDRWAWEMLRMSK